MGHKNNKAATVESAQTDAAPAQPQSVPTQDSAPSGTVPASADAGATTSKSQPIGAGSDQPENGFLVRMKTRGHDLGEKRSDMDKLKPINKCVAVQKPLKRIVDSRTCNDQLQSKAGQHAQTIAAAPARSEDDFSSVPAADAPPPERDSVTPAPLAPDAPYAYGDLDDKTFHSTLSHFVKQAQEKYADFGLTLYCRILPGLQDAQRRFTEHEDDAQYRLDGCSGIEEYIKKLGLKPARVRKWRQRDKERQFMRELKLLSGINICQHCGQEKGHAPSCPHYVPPPPPPPENETEAALLAEQCLRMTKTLLGPSLEPLTERVKKVISMAESVQEAAASGRYDGADFSEHRSSQDTRREPVPEPERGSLEELARRISVMADTDDIGPAVQKYLDHLFERFRDAGLILQFQVSARREGRERIDFGDWVELPPYSGTDKQIGRVVGRDKLRRPVIQWFEADAWLKPRSLLHNSDSHVHVLAAEEAQGTYADAFASYRPTKPEVETSSATLPVQAPAEPARSTAHQTEGQSVEEAGGELDESLDKPVAAPAANRAMQSEQSATGNGDTNRYHLAERRMGDLKELIIMDGDKIYDCYPWDAKEEAQATIEKLNTPMVKEKPETVTAEGEESILLS